MKSKPNSTPPDAAPKPSVSRSPHRVHALLKGKSKGTLHSRNAAADALDAAIASNGTNPILTTIRQDFATLTAPALLARVHAAKDGLTDNFFYQDLPPSILPSLGATEAALVSAADNRAAAENMLRTARAAEALEMANAVEILRTAATACETVDRSDEAVVSAGWTPRRTAGRPKPVPAPARITLKNTAYAGGVGARWPRVSNAHFYEMQAAITVGAVDPAVWDTLPVIPNGPTRYTFTDKPVGHYLTVRVRGNGSKGPSPWTDTTTIRIN